HGAHEARRARVVHRVAAQDEVNPRATATNSLHRHHRSTRRSRCAGIGTSGRRVGSGRRVPARTAAHSLSGCTANNAGRGRVAPDGFNRFALYVVQTFPMLAGAATGLWIVSPREHSERAGPEIGRRV